MNYFHYLTWVVIVIILLCLSCELTSCKKSEDDGAPLLLFTRYDRDAYLKSKGGSGSADYPITREKIIKQLNANPPPESNDPYAKCTTYLAPSSIPNSGLGMYTTIPYNRGESFPYPEIGIMLHDMNSHYPSRQSRLLSQYPWSSKVLSFGLHEAWYGESMVPSLGMLANSHLGLVNMRHTEFWQVQRWLDGTDTFTSSDTFTLNDVGRGAYSYHGHVMFETSANIRAGEELFVSYGDEWFTARTSLLGAIPGANEFKLADEMLKEFVEKKNLEEEESTPTNNKRTKLADDYTALLNEAFKQSERLSAAFPDKVEDVAAALEKGTARISAKESIRSLEWLEENGRCIDNIISGVTTIPQAGRGAFATRPITKGGVITTTPVVTLEREQLYLWEKVNETDDGNTVKELVGHQLFLNYCYGHKGSSLLFFPYSPTINFINHGSNNEDVNAEIRWSTHPYHKRDWLDVSIDEMKEKLKTGLMFDIIAKKDLQRGEEILLNYGTDWEDSWNQHIAEWGEIRNEGDVILPHQFNMTDRLGAPTIMNLNRLDNTPIVRTISEQEKNPYPSYITTKCRFVPPTEQEVSEEKQNEEEKECTPSDDNDCQQIQKPIRWKGRHEDTDYVYPCTILTRTTINDLDWYTADIVIPTWITTKVDNADTASAGKGVASKGTDTTKADDATTKTTEKKKERITTQHLVEYIPRYAIIFMDKSYTMDQYAVGTFRKEIGLPDEMIPQHWMDMIEERW